MSNTIQGVVQKVQKNESRGTWGIKVNNTWYGTYKTEPKVSDGDEITFEAKQNGDFWNADAKTIKRVGRASGGGGSSGGEGATTPAKAGGYSGGGNGYNSKERLELDERKLVLEASKQRSIEFQAARNSAIEFVGKLLSAGIVALGGNKAEQTGIVELYLAKYTNQFYADTQKLEASAPNAEAGSSKGATTRKAPAKAPEPEPEDRNDDPDDDIPF